MTNIASMFKLWLVVCCLYAWLVESRQQLLGRALNTAVAYDLFDHKLCHKYACGNAQLFAEPMSLERVRYINSVVPTRKYAKHIQEKLDRGENFTNAELSYHYYLGDFKTVTAHSNATHIKSHLYTLTPLHKPVNILIFSVWIGDPVNVTELNHYQYAKHRGYDYKLFYFTAEEYKSITNNAFPYGWTSILAAEQLLALPEYQHYDYFVKLDFDCLFARMDLPLETFIDPFHQYSLYMSQIGYSRFMQTHTWIMKNSNYSRSFMAELSTYKAYFKCGNIAQEQGAFHIVIGYKFKEYYGENVTVYECDRFCNSLRSSWRHHQCVLNWFEDNGFGLNGRFVHPHIFLYDYNDKYYISPDSGYTYQLDPVKLGNWQNLTISPLTIHPCKQNVTIPPQELMTKAHVC